MVSRVNFPFLNRNRPKHEAIKYSSNIQKRYEVAFDKVTHVILDLVPSLGDRLNCLVLVVALIIEFLNRLLQGFFDVIQSLAVADDGADDHDDKRDLETAEADILTDVKPLALFQS